MCAGCLIPAAARGELPGELAEALSLARAGHRLLIVALLDEASSKTPWLRSELEGSAWRSLAAPHEQRIFATTEGSSLTKRFAINDLPSFIVLDGEGRDFGRVGGEFPLEAAGHRLREVLDAAERYSGSLERLKDSPEDAQALYWVGACEWNRGDHASAARRFEKVAGLGLALRLGSRDLLADALRMLGETRLELDHFVEAEDSFRRSLLANGSPEQISHAALGLSRSLRRQGRAREAVGVLEAHFPSETPRPGLDEALFTLGYLRSELGDGEQAAQCFLAVIERFPSSRYARRAERYGFKARGLPLEARNEGPGPVDGDAARFETAPAVRPAGFSQVLTTVSVTGSNLRVDELR